MGKNFLAGLKEVLGPSGEGSGSTGEDSKLDRQLKLQDAIAASNSQLKVHKKELKELKKRRRDIAANKADSPSNHQLAKKLKKIEKEAKLTASLVSAMEDTLADQVESLKKLNSSGKEGKGGESDESAVDWDDISDTDTMMIVMTVNNIYPNKVNLKICCSGGTNFVLGALGLHSGTLYRAYP